MSELTDKYLQKRFTSGKGQRSFYTGFQRRAETAGVEAYEG